MLKFSGLSCIAEVALEKGVLSFGVEHVDYNTHFPQSLFDGASVSVCGLRPKSKNTLPIKKSFLGLTLTLLG